MKKIITLLVLICLLTAVSGQTDSTKTKLIPYASIGLSIGHVDPNDANIDNFNKASFPSVEVGVMGNNISLGVVFGAENLFVSSTTRGFYELKTAISKPIGKCNGYVLFGAGAFIEKGFNNFIEYGGGFSYVPKRVGYYIQYSNWARTNYVTGGLIIIL